MKGFTGLQAVRPTHNPPRRHTYLSPTIPSTVSTEVCVWAFGLLVQHTHSTSQDGHLSLGLSTSQPILFCCSQLKLILKPHCEMGRYVNIGLSRAKPGLNAVLTGTLPVTCLLSSISINCFHISSPLLHSFSSSFSLSLNPPYISFTCS